MILPLNCAAGGPQLCEGTESVRPVITHDGGIQRISTDCLHNFTKGAPANRDAGQQDQITKMAIFPLLSVCFGFSGGQPTASEDKIISRRIRPEYAGRRNAVL